MPTVIVSVPKDPNKGVTVEAKGVVGTRCQALTSRIEQALGKQLKDDLKDEYYQTEIHDQQHELQ